MPNPPTDMTDMTTTSASSQLSAIIINSPHFHSPRARAPICLLAFCQISAFALLDTLRPNLRTVMEHAYCQNIEILGR